MKLERFKSDRARHGVPGIAITIRGIAAILSTNRSVDQGKNSCYAHEYDITICCWNKQIVCSLSFIQQALVEINVMNYMRKEKVINGILFV